MNDVPKSFHTLLLRVYYKTNHIELFNALRSEIHVNKKIKFLSLLHTCVTTVFNATLIVNIK
jgi:hypothetical protein